MEKIKYFIESDKGKDILTVLIIILVGLGSFGLGRLSKNVPKEPLRVIYEGEEVNIDKPVSSAINSTKTTTGAFFASSKGSKYYSLGCSAGKTIKQENRVYFNTREEAENAGYSLSTSCQ
jgi:Metal binding domain of Ada